MARRRQDGITIRAVAERAGVSAMTVSNVINGAGRASPATAANVRAAIAELGYVPNLAARRLAKARATTVGLIYCNRRTPFLDAVLVGTLRATNAHGLQLILREGEGATREEAETIARDLTRSGADALLVIPPFAELLSGSPALAELEVPVATIATGTALPDIMTVRIDNREAMFSITERIIARGHRRIAFIAGPETYSVIAERLEGYRDALRRHAIEEDPTLFYRGNFDNETGVAAADLLLRAPVPPSAIVCCSDDVAAGVVAQASRMGVKVPEALAVTGFDDTPLASRLWPPLTAVSQPVEDMAFRAAQCLIDALAPTADPDAPTDLLFDYAVRERESTSAGPVADVPLSMSVVP